MGGPAARSIKREQMRILGIAEAWYESSVLSALLKLGLFDLIGEGEVSVQELADKLSAQPETLRRLLRGGAVIGVLESADGERFTVPPAAQSILLRSAGRSYLGNWILNLDYMKEAMARLDEAVLTSAPTDDLQTDLSEGADRTREFILAMHNYAALRGDGLPRALDTTGVTSMLDIGCGPGTYSWLLGQANPELELHLLDLPEVLDVAKEVEASYSLTNAVHYHPADVRSDDIPGSYDLVLLSNVLHMLGPEESRKLLARLHDVVQPGGSVVVQAQYLDDDRRGGRWPVLMDLQLLSMTPAGKNHSVEETKGWLAKAGFVDVEHSSMGLLNTNSLLRAHRR